jgi:hypothetical protein
MWLEDVLLALAFAAIALCVGLVIWWMFEGEDDE